MNMSGYLKIGVFFLTLGAAGTGFIVMSNDGFNSWNTKLYEVVIDDATGLTTNSDVYMAGVPIGKIRQIDLTGGRALLRFAVRDEITVDANATISRRSASILGTSVLVLTPGPEGSPVLKPGDRLVAVVSAGDFSAAAGTIQDLSHQVSSLLSKLDERSDAEMDRISRILESTALITERVESMLREREGDIGASAVELHAVLANLRVISDSIRNGEGNLGQALGDDKLYQGLLSTTEKADRAAAELEQALKSVNQLAKSADRVVTEAGTVVSKATGLGVEVDSGASWDFLSASGRGAASLRLEPRKGDRWYRIGVSSVPEGVASSTTETSSSGTTTTVSTIGFDAEIARRMGAFTLRGGLLESTAGIGLDFNPARWLCLSGEVFDFASNGPPNLRGEVSLYPFFDPSSDKFWNWLYLRGGIDSALSAENRDFYLGAGLRFTDDEVKGLVGLIPLSQ